MAQLAKARKKPAASTAVGGLIRQWRERRRLSQLTLALDAEISARHLSFLETGRANPSREMVLLLARVLEVPPPRPQRAPPCRGLRPRLSRAWARRAGDGPGPPRPRIHPAPTGALSRARGGRPLEYPHEQR